MQFLLSPFRLHSQHQHLVYLDAAPPHSNCRVLGSKPGVQKKKPTTNPQINIKPVSYSSKLDLALKIMLRRLSFPQNTTRSVFNF